MTGTLRFYDTHFYDLMRGMHAFQTDALKVILVADTYIPCPVFGTRDGLVAYATGDVVYSSLYQCFFVAAQGGTTTLGAPVFSTTLGALTVDGTVVWASCGMAPPSAHTCLADVSAHEIPNGSGYTTGGLTLTQSPALVGKKAVLNLSRAEWLGAITAKYAVIHKLGTANGVVNPLICYVLLNASGANAVSTDGTFLITFDNDALYSLGGWPA